MTVDPSRMERLMRSPLAVSTTYIGAKRRRNVDRVAVISESDRSNALRAIHQIRCFFAMIDAAAE